MNTMNTTENPPILCGTEFSENAAQAATVAAVLATRSGKTLLLVHAADEFNALGDDQETLTASLRPAVEQLRAEADRLKEMGATVETTVLTGDVAEEVIKEFGKERAAALTVVSREDKTAFDRWTLGSVSEQLAEADPVPTLVVRTAAPFEAWARGERPLKVFVATDFASVSDAALRWVRDLRDLGPCDIVVAHVDRPREECDRLGIVPSAMENPPIVERVLERDLREKVRAQLGEESVRFVIKPALGRLDVRIIALAVEAQADLIVVGTHQRHGLGRVGHSSVSRAILREAPMSVACIPATALAAEGALLPEIRRVLVATDFSELGDRAVPYACGLLREGGTVFLLHVAQPKAKPGPLTMNLGSKADEALEKEHTTRLREASSRLRALVPAEAAERGVATKVAVVEPRGPNGAPHRAAFYDILGEAHVLESSDPAKAICQAAERLGADVICIGSHGRSGLSAMLTGSTTQAVIAQSRRPVLVVRPPAG